MNCNNRKANRGSPDVFIAYHGTNEQGGSLARAEALFNFLSLKDIKCYFYPRSEGRWFAKTPSIVQTCKKFILVCNRSIPRTKKGMLNTKKCNGVLQEIEAFSDCVYHNRRKKGDARVYAYDGMTGKDANKLHTLFGGVEHIQEEQNQEQESFETVFQWLTPQSAKSCNIVKQQKSIDAKSLQTASEIKEASVRRALMNEKMNEKWNLKKMILRAKKIECLGISNNAMTLNMDRVLLVEALKKHAQIELLFLSPKSKFTKMREREEGLESGTIKSNTMASLKFVINLKNENPSEAKTLRLYTYDLIPRMNMIIIDGAHMLLQYYANTIPGETNPCFYIKKQYKNQIFDFYYAQYKNIRSKSKEV